MPGIDAVPYLTNISILELERVPEHLVVVGGSYIGLEFAQMAVRRESNGDRERYIRLIAREDADVSEAIRGILEADGVQVRTSAECISFAPANPGIAVKVGCTQGSPEILASDVLLAIGRRPNTDDLGLERVGVSQIPFLPRVSETGSMTAWGAASLVQMISTTHTLKLCEVRDARNSAAISKACLPNSLVSAVSAPAIEPNEPVSPPGLCSKKFRS